MVITKWVARHTLIAMADRPRYDNDGDTTHTVNESADKIRVETKVKRGGGTRDQDEIKVKVKGDNPDDVVEKLDEVVANLKSTSQALREMQPMEDDT